MIPVLNKDFKKQIEKVKNLILHEINVKEIDFIEEEDTVLVKKIKPDFKVLGPRYGKIMKAIADRVAQCTQQEIATIEKEGKIVFEIESQQIELLLSDVEIFAEDIPGWIVTNQGLLTVALDISISDALKREGYARELVNRIQNYRKDIQFDVVDKITVLLQNHPELDAAFRQYEDYIKAETLCTDLSFASSISTPDKTSFEISDNVNIDVVIRKL
jgi:isoleucyl-tRNA synthetase